jgi:3-hydroxybutyryl-CoA dehydratase
MSREEVEVPLLPWVVDGVGEEEMSVIARMLEDPNPIHLDREAVREFGLGDRLINQGPANIAYLFNMLSAAFPEDEIRSLDVRLRSNVFEGQRLTACGEIVALDRDEQGEQVECNVWLDAEDGSRAVAGTAIISRSRVSA